MVPRELKALLGELDMYYILSSFLGSYEKMADVDISPIRAHDKTNAHSDETGENIPSTTLFNPGEGSSWEPECEQEHHLEK